MRSMHRVWSACCGSEMCETTGDTRALARVCVVDKAGRTVLQVSLELGVLVPCPPEWIYLVLCRTCIGLPSGMSVRTGLHENALHALR